jgi:hypothetical protein
LQNVGRPRDRNQLRQHDDRAGQGGSRKRLNDDDETNASDNFVSGVTLKTKNKRPA